MYTYIRLCHFSRATVFLQPLDGDPLDQGSSLLGNLKYNKFNSINSIIPLFSRFLSLMKPVGETSDVTNFYTNNETYLISKWYTVPNLQLFAFLEGHSVRIVLDLQMFDVIIAVLSDRDEDQTGEFDGVGDRVSERLALVVSQLGDDELNEVLPARLDRNTLRDKGGYWGFINVLGKGCFSSFILFYFILSPGRTLSADDRPAGSFVVIVTTLLSVYHWALSTVCSENFQFLFHSSILANHSFSSFFVFQIAFN